MPMTPQQRRNATKCAVGEGLFGVGMGLVAPMTVMPLLLRYLGAGDVAVGLTGSLSWAGWVLLQPLGLFLLSGKRRTKRFLIPWSMSFSVPCYLAMALVVYRLGVTRPLLCAWLVLGLFAVRILGAGAAVPFWFDWHAKIFEQRIRGRVVGMMAGASCIGVSLAALVAGKVAQFGRFPGNYTFLFASSVIFFLVALLGFFRRVEEPESLSEPYDPPTHGDLWRLFGHSLREENYRNYLIGRVFMTLGAGAAAFYAVYFSSAEGGGLTAAKVITLGTFLTIPQAISSLLLGRLGDRRGHKIGIIVGAVAQLASILVAVFGRGAVACAVCFSLVGVAWSAAWVSHQNMLFETCPHDSRLAHITLSNMLLGPFVFLVPLATGWLMNFVPARSVGIALTALPTGVGILWLLLVVKDPREIELNGTQVREMPAPRPEGAEQ